LATRKEIREDWFERGVEEKQDYLLVICDTSNYEDYPVFCKEEDLDDMTKYYENASMQEKLAVYNLKLNREKQFKDL